MANLGSEVSRLLSSIEKNDFVMVKNCKERSEKILHTIETQPEMKPRKRELEILKAVLDDLFEKKFKYSVSAEELNNYFLPFAMRVMQGKS